MFTSLAFPAKDYSTTQFISTAFLKKNLTPKIAIEINDIQTLLELVKTENWHTILTQTTFAKSSQIKILEKNKSEQK